MHGGHGLSIDADRTRREFKGEGANVLGLDADGVLAGEAGLHVRAFPMLVHAVDAQPGRLGVAQRVRAEPDFPRNPVAALRDELLEARRERGFGRVVIFVGGLWADKTFQFEVRPGHGGVH